MAVEGGDGVFSRSISQLVSILRRTFRSKEFDEVEEILVAREAKFKKELKKKEKENEFLGSKLEVMRLEKMSVEAELEELGDKAEMLLNLIDIERSHAQEGKKRPVNKQMAVSGNVPVSPRNIVEIMGSDDECLGKAPCVKRTSSGNLEDRGWTNVEIRRGSLDKSMPKESEADGQNDIILGSNLMSKSLEIVAKSDCTFGKAIPSTHKETEKHRSRRKQGRTSCFQCKTNARDKPSSVKRAVSTNDGSLSSDYNDDDDDDAGPPTIRQVPSQQQWGRTAIRSGPSRKSMRI